MDTVAMQFRIARFILGLYLLEHFIELIPYADELFGKKMLFDPSLGPTSHIFPSIFNLIDVNIIMIFIVLITLYFIFGSHSVNVNICALVLWFFWASIINRNILISNPGIPYIGWLLLVYACEINDTRYRINIIWLSWFIMGLGYTISGLHKLDCPSWLDGSALTHVLNSPLARDNMLRDYVINSLPIMLKLGTWFSLFLEISFLPLGLFYHTRFWYWITYFFFHLGIIMLVNFSDLTLGVFMVHVLTFDINWVLKLVK